MRIALRIGLVLAVLVLPGCLMPYGGTFRYRGPGDVSDLARALNQCVQQTPSNSCSELRLCLAAKGYIQDSNGNIDATPVAVRCRP